MPIELDLRGRVAFVTGSTRGIGSTVADSLASAGADVVIASRSDGEAASSRALKLAQTHGVRAFGVACDQTSSEQIRNAYKRIKDEFGQLDILVNNAGVMNDALIGMITDEVVESNFVTNAFGPIHHIQSATRLMRRSKHGSIINMTSIIGTSGNAGQLAYAGSKAALLGVTSSAAKELAPLGIRVNAIAPGFVDTDLTAALGEGPRVKAIESIAMGRAGTPADIANVVLFLASDLSSYVTGQVIGVDGGMRI